jgi:hypothetical protein
MLLTPEALAAGLALVTPEDFYVPAHAHIFEAIADQVSKGAERVTAGTTVAALNGHAGTHQLNVLDLVQFTSDVPGSASVAPQYAEIVRSLSRRRHQIALAAELAQAAADGDDAKLAKLTDELVAVREDAAGITTDPQGPPSIDWESFWSVNPPREDFLVEPVLAVGRQTAIFSAAKVGKSLLALEIAAALATGRPVLGQAAAEPCDVCYLDLEMVSEDLRSRLEDLGYGPDDDLSCLHYFQLPSLPPLDSDAGGELFSRMAIRDSARLVVIDTMARAVTGEENSADTYRDFYTYTGRRLKSAGIALLRLDHQGKEASRGPRGSSAKDDDVDIVFHLTVVNATTLRLTRTRSRVAWIPPEVDIDRHDEPRLHHAVSVLGSWPAGTADTADALTELDVPLDATVRTARAALQREKRGRNVAIVAAALRYRRGHE